MSTRNPPRRALVRAATSTVIVLSLAGCSAPSDDAAGAAQALTSQVTTVGCSGYETKVQNAVNALYGAVVTQPDALRGCLRNAILTPDDGRSAEWIVNVLASQQHTSVRCVDPATASPCGGHSSWNGCTEGVVNGAIQMRLARDFVQESDFNQIASVMLHELLHHYGFLHLGGVEGPYSVNEQAQSCFTTKANTGVATPNGAPRTSMRGEVELQQFGGGGGVAFERFCAVGSHVVAATMTASVDGPTAGSELQFSCAPDAGGAAVDLPPVGAPPVGPALAPAHRACASGEVVVGLLGVHATGGTVGDFALLCRPRAEVLAGVTSPAPALAAFGDTPVANLLVERRCPPASALRAVLGRAGGSIDQLRLVCEALGASTPSGEPVAATPLGGAGVGTEARTSRELCSDRGVAMGLYGRAGVTVDRLGARCRGTERPSSGALRFRAEAVGHITPAQGRTEVADNETFALACPPAWALVGVRAGTHPATGTISFVRAECAPIGAWDGMDPEAEIDESHLQAMAPSPGTNTMNELPSRCPYGSFVAGLEVRSGVITATGQRSVDTVVPLCRRIGG